MNNVCCCCSQLTLKVLSKIAAYNIQISFYYNSEKIRLGISSKLSTARQMIQMKYQALLSLKNKTNKQKKPKNIKMSSAAVVIN